MLSVIQQHSNLVANHRFGPLVFTSEPSSSSECASLYEQQIFDEGTTATISCLYVNTVKCHEMLNPESLESFTANVFAV